MSGNKTLSRELSRIKAQKAAIRKDRKSYTVKSLRDMIEIYDKREAETRQSLSIAVISFYKHNDNNTVEIISNEFAIAQTAVNKILNNYLNITPQLT